MAERLLDAIPSIPYPPSQAGRWSPVTSTLNWCEEDYYATIYAAEIVNTLTNLLFMFLAFKGIVNCLRNGHDHVFLVAFIGYLLVGTGSFLFHATLKYPMQLVDELSMIYTTCLMCFATFAFGKSQRYSLVLATSLLSLAVFITVYYHINGDPAFHQRAYALLTAIVLFRSIWVMEVNMRPRFRTLDPDGGVKATAVQEKEDKRDEVILRKMWTLIGCGLSIFLGGFALWTLDNIYCSTLRRWRRQVGLPWGILLEGHGWWHLMTGVGAYFYIVWGVWLRHCLNHKQENYELDWPRWTSMPAVIKRRSPQIKRYDSGHGNGHTNGHANGHSNGSAKTKKS